MKTFISLAGILAFLLMTSHPSAQRTNAAIDDFNASVSAYAMLHRQVELTVPPQKIFADPREGLATVAALRDALRAARANAREGDVFANASDELRRRIRWALRENGFESRDLVADMLADTEEGARPLVVNESFSWALGNLMPAFLIRALPELPDELQYRLVGPDLALIDLDPNLVVDILRDALPGVTLANTKD
jgi:hypothetical protein